jgi:hypothetical protein
VELAAPAGVAGPVAAPTRLRVPSLAIDSPLDPLTVDASGALVPPEDWHRAGWFAQGPAPGAQGPAVIAGHLDSRDGPGVFADLARLRAGDQVQVRRADGSSASFVVTRSQVVAKTAFPTAEVYGAVAAPELRLITCGGAFDRRTGHYVDDVVVFARLA